MKKISLLHATRNTPQRALATKKIWLERATNPENVEHIFGIQSDDKESHLQFETAARSVPPPEWASSSVANWNLAAAYSNARCNDPQERERAKQIFETLTKK